MSGGGVSCRSKFQIRVLKLNLLIMIFFRGDYEAENEDRPIYEATIITANDSFLIAFALLFLRSS